MALHERVGLRPPRGSVCRLLSPTAVVAVVARDGARPLFPPGQAVDVDVKLTLPEGGRNARIGLFQLTVEVLAPDGEVRMTSPSHPIPSHPISSHLIPSHLISSHLIPSHPPPARRRWSRARASR